MTWQNVIILLDDDVKTIYTYSALSLISFFKVKFLKKYFIKNYSKNN